MLLFYCIEPGLPWRYEDLWMYKTRFLPIVLSLFPERTGNETKRIFYWARKKKEGGSNKTNHSRSSSSSGQGRLTGKGCPFSGRYTRRPYRAESSGLPANFLALSFSSLLYREREPTKTLTVSYSICTSCSRFNSVERTSALGFSVAISSVC